MVIDFTSSNYLGLRHASSSLPQWARLTSGVPAALAEPEAARALAAGLARLTGTDHAVLATSTLHAFWDLFVIRARLADQAGKPGIALYRDVASYPISGWGMERAAGRGVPFRFVPHHDPESLRRILAGRMLRQFRPVLATDGFCPGCGRAAPLAELLTVLRRFGGELVLDDTQPLGLLGLPRANSGYGHGGGGSLAHAGVSGPDIILVSSLAKAFGVPVAVIGGSAGFIRDYQAQSQTRMHCSPPSFAHIAAGTRALAVNQLIGGRLRAHVAGLVDRFRQGLYHAGLPVPAGRFPVQSLPLAPPLDPVPVYRGLVALGVRPVLHRSTCLRRTAVSFLITADHSAADVDTAVAALIRVIGTAQAAVGVGVRRAGLGGPVEIIDSHCHAGHGDGLTGPWDTSAPLGAYLRRARVAGIGRTVVFPAFHSDYAVANEEVARIVASRPGRLTGYAMVNPVRDAGRIEPMIRRAVQEWGFCGIKVHRHDGRITREVCETARRFSLPILYDVMGESAAVELIAAEYPNVAFIIPHLGSFADDWSAQRAVIDQMVRHPNVYTDTSGIRRFDLLAEAVTRAGPAKVLFGSDGPWLHPGVELAKVTALELPARAANLIRGGNWLRLTARARAHQSLRFASTGMFRGARPARPLGDAELRDRGDPWAARPPLSATPRS